MVARGKRQLAAGALLPALVAGFVYYAMPARAADSETGLPIPRFASLRSDQVNLRTGPGERYPIDWVLTRKDMPVEILAEFEHYRKVRDWQGTVGWVHQRMVTGKREVIVKGALRAMRRRPDGRAQIVARAEPGVVARLIECQGAWCRIEAEGIEGWLLRTDVWGVYPDEVLQ
jgi:SH3-like domain-containing protein